MFKKNMFTEAIPERVFALCNLLKEGPLKEKEVKEKMEPKCLKVDSPYFGIFKNTAIELGLVNEQDQVLTLAVDSSVIDSFNSFRLYIVKNLYKYNDGDFYKTTKAIYKNNVEYIKNDIKSLSAKEMLDMLEKHFDRIEVKEIRGWRFWATFLGFGIASGDDGMLFLPNAFNYLKYVIYNSNINKETIIPFSEFLKTINQDIQIIHDMNSRELNFGLSSGLRMLHDLEYVELSYNMDTADFYKLYPLTLHNFGNNVSHIIIKGGKSWT